MVSSIKRYWYYETQYNQFADETGTSTSFVGKQSNTLFMEEFKQVLAATPYKTPTVRPPAPYHENYSS